MSEQLSEGEEGGKKKEEHTTVLSFNMRETERERKTERERDR